MRASPGYLVTAVHMLRLLLVLFALAAGAAAAAEGGTVTLLRGTAWLLRDAARHPLAEGLRLRAGDAVEVESGLTQLEFADGAVLGLAAAARVLLLEQGSGPAADVFVLGGFVKLANRPAPAPSSLQLAFVPGRLRAPAGTAVAQADGEGLAVFLERGEALVEGSSAGSERFLRAGEFCRCAPATAAAVLPRPDAAFLGALPALFRDILQPRLSRFPGPGPEPGAGSVLRYEQVRGWLRSAPVRALFPRLWQAALQDPAFRAAVAANLSQHPEWAPLLRGSARRRS